MLQQFVEFGPLNMDSHASFSWKPLADNRASGFALRLEVMT
jgi:hypothetical protein